MREVLIHGVRIREPLYVQYGCGSCAPEEWVNFDASLRLRIDRTPVLKWLSAIVGPSPFPANVHIGDICRGLPIPDGAAAGVYCSHILEHLPRAALAQTLLHTKRMLIPGGRFRLVVPDLLWRAQRYVEAANQGDRQAADQFMHSCMLGKVNRQKGLVAILRESYGLSGHLWMYDFAALKSLLEQAGFVGVRKCELGDSDDPMFSLVEDRERFFEAEEHELALEAVKPDR